MAKKIRVAVLGGGMGALAAAWELSRHGGYEIDIYQRDWRLGGKGASGRNLAPELGNRVEEHGLHVLMGFYDNTFHVLKQCYDEVARSPNASKCLRWHEAFTGWDSSTMTDPRSDGSPGLWRLWLPPNRQEIGQAPRPVHVPDLFYEARRWFNRFKRDYLRQLGKWAWIGPLQAAANGVALLYRFLAGTRLAEWWPLALLQRFLLLLLRISIERDVRRLYEFSRKGSRVQPPGSTAAGPDALELSDGARRLLIAILFTGGNLVGMIRDKIVLPPYDFGAIDDHDYRVWLDRHTPVDAPAPLGRSSPIVEGFYDLAFSHNQTLSAGTTLYCVLRCLLDYNGHWIYLMNGGMGDVIFAPIFYALRNRGVRIHFFHEVKAIEANQNGSAVSRIVLSKLYEVPDDYEPLGPVTTNKGHSQYCWPNQPPDTLAPSGEELVLEAGENFEVAVLGISIGGLRPICGDLAEKNPRIETMLSELGTTATQTLQLWVDRSLEELGWSLGPSILISHVRPFNTWADMGHVLPYETWNDPPQTLGYFVDALEDSDYAREDPDQVVKENARRYIEGSLHELWPKLVWADLHDPEGGSEEERLDRQYWRANTEGSDRYVLAEAGGLKYRLAPDESGFHNLALAGDWLKLELSAGALEGATMGGLGAARAIEEGRVHA